MVRELELPHTAFKLGGHIKWVDLKRTDLIIDNAIANLLIIDGVLIIHLNWVHDHQIIIILVEIVDLLI